MRLPRAIPRWDVVDHPQKRISMRIQRNFILSGYMFLPRWSDIGRDTCAQKEWTRTLSRPDGL